MLLPGSVLQAVPQLGTCRHFIEPLERRRALHRRSGSCTSPLGTPERHRGAVGAVAVPDHEVAALREGEDDHVSDRRGGASPVIDDL